jgi:hypothetical protein
MPRGTPGQVALGPGYLYIAILGTAEPADLTTPWASVSPNWITLGYTAEGSEFTYKPNVDKVEVAEELDPIQYAITGRDLAVKFAMAQITANNMKRALNGGTITTGSGFVTFEPPDLGAEVRQMIGWESEDHQERWVWRQCFQQGEISIARKKGSDKATIPVEFTLEKPAGAAPFKAMFLSPGRL